MSLQYSLTPEQFDDVAAKLETSLRADMSIFIQEATGGKAKVNALDLFQLLGMVHVKLAQSIRKLYPGEDKELAPEEVQLERSGDGKA